jgi:surface antigen
MNTSKLARHLTAGALLTAACVISPLAQAAGWGAALRDAPLRDFTDEDITQHLAAIRKALDSADPKAVVEWRNDATGAGSKISVIGQPKRQGYGACKRVSTLSFSKKRKGYATPFTVCKNAEGRWVVAGS